jgi:hypothetical protein
MSRRIQIATVVVLASASSVSFAAVDGTAANRPFRITSTLDGKKVLPHRIRWVAHPAIPRSRVAKVEFLIDGKLRWVERKAPYVYGDDTDWLVTSWLTPGPHRFAVRVAPVHGPNATDATTAQVPVAIACPRARAAARVARREGNGWCEDTNEPVRYRWAVTGNQLTLTLAGRKRCGDQATVLSGAGVQRGSGGTCTPVP